MTAVDLPVARPTGRSLLVAMRPRQWVKNLLVFAAPMAAGALFHRHVAVEAALTFVAFTCVAAACYLVNDVYDRDNDRLHPQKRLRPVASGTLTVGVAVFAAVTLLIAGIFVMLPLDREIATATLIVYAATVVLYGAWLKRVPGVELVVLSFGFVLRPLAGAAATGVPPSPWFLLVCCCAALTIALGKRQVELVRLSTSATAHRAALRAYTPRGLRRARLAAAAGMVAAYALWALSRASRADRVIALVTLVPVIGAVIRLIRLNDSGVGDAPETIVFTDRWMQLCCAVWVLAFCLGPGRV
jgi:decaprenyl-phosphate phosphoribosyltransferase